MTARLGVVQHSVLFGQYLDCDNFIIKAFHVCKLLSSASRVHTFLLFVTWFPTILTCRLRLDTQTTKLVTWSVNIALRIITQM